jgi:hypothetical protein
MPAVFQQHTCVSRRSSTCEQKNPEVREGVGIANQSSSIISSHKSTTSNSSYLSPIDQARPPHLEETPGPPSSLFEPLRRNIVAVAKPTIVATDHREEYLSGYPPPTTIPWQASSSFPHRNLATVEHFSSPILFTAGIHYPHVLLYNQGYPKVCPDPLNLPNTGDPFAGTSSLSSYSLFSPTRELIALI